jgi:putative ABC transport system substrate-binding protein
VIFAIGGTGVRSLQQLTRNVPIVFAGVTDPVGAGVVASLARPGGNATGFLQLEYGQSAKWLELLKQVAPGVTRVAVIRDPTSTGGNGQFGAIQAVAPAVGVELRPVDARDAKEIDSIVAAFALTLGGGLIITTGASALLHRELILTLASRYSLPAVYPYRLYAVSGGLISYGLDPVDPYRLAAGYVDRILKGEKPADLRCRRLPSTRR